MAWGRVVSCARSAQRIVVFSQPLADPGDPCDPGNGFSGFEQAGAFGGLFRGEHGGAAHGPGLIEGAGPPLFELPAPAHQRAARSAKGGGDLAGAGMAVVHKGGQRQAVPGGVVGGVREVVVGTDEPGRAPFLCEQAYGGIDSNCPLGHSGQKHLWHGAGKGSAPSRECRFSTRPCAMPLPPVRPNVPNDFPARLRSFKNFRGGDQDL